MNRRTFMQAAGAAAGTLLVPSWLRFKQRRTIDLTPFCADYESTRWGINQPFAQDGMVYATDARVCVRTLLADAPQLDGEVRLPPCSTLPWWESGDRWKPWPRLALKADTCDSKCPICLGRGGVECVVKCGVCHGEGEETLPTPRDADDWEFGDHYSITCRCCKGTGYQHADTCDYCGGAGWTHKPAIQPIGGEYICGAYDAIIRRLGDVEYALVPDFVNKQLPSEVVLFRGDGFEGVLMPLCRRRA